MIEIIHGDCLDVMPSLGEFDCVFMDPPDNIGLGYDDVNDLWPDDEAYGEFVLDAADGVRSPIIWVSFNAKWLPLLGGMFGVAFSDWRIKPCVQTFTFGQHRETDFGNNHRPLWRISRPGAPFYPDNIRVESWRQANGDKRANPKGRVPSDIFDFPRVTGNSHQRRRWHPTQLNEGLVERCILSCTKPGDRVLDPFAGTGTTGRVCRRIGRECVLIEKSEFYVQKMREEFAEQEALDAYHEEIGVAG